MKQFLTTCFFVLLVWPVEPCLAANENIVQVHLTPEYTTFTKGQVARLGIQFEIKKGWHIYWLNPGESGLAPRLTWQPNSALEFSDAHWPHPEMFVTEQIQNFGYEGSATVIQKFKIQKNFQGNQVDLQGKVEWLACQEVCIPGKQDLSQTLKVGNKATIDSKAKDALDQASLQVPQDIAYWYIKVIDRDDHLLLKILPQKKLVEQDLEITFFPLTPGLSAMKIKGKRHAANLFKVKKLDSFSKDEKTLKGVAVANYPFDEENKYTTLNIDQPIQ